MAAKTSYRLEMQSPADLHPLANDSHGMRIEKMGVPCPEFNKFLHTVVGYDYRWGGRRNWGETEWCEYATREGLETWVAYIGGTPAGYFELEKHPNGDVQIHCFGLLPQFVGKGLGAALLTRTVERAWELSEGIVFLNTCSHDHPRALKNYQACGFKIAKSQE
ncbi:MAG: GNAT family N-acetyltransferase, partial [Spirochaetales bacterium]|nr:GNAT family N-acetyltransferase [Spirochaetales bacterium]